MALQTTPMMHWSEPRLVLSPTDTFKACALGGQRYDEHHLREIWVKSRFDARLRGELHDGATFGLHLLLDSVDYADLFAFPSPFISKDQL